MVDYSYRTTQTGRGPMYDIQTENGPARVFFDDGLLNHRTLGPSVTCVRDGFDTINRILASKAPGSNRNGMIDAAKDGIANHLKSQINQMTNEYHGAVSAITKRKAAALAPQFSDSMPPPLRVEKRTYLRSLKESAQMALIEADPSLGAILVEGGLAMSGWPPEAFARVERGVAITKAYNNLAGETEYRSKPSVDDPIGGVLDVARARAAAEAEINALDDEAARLTDVRALMDNIIATVSTLIDEPKAAGLALLVGDQGQ